MKRGLQDVVCQVFIMASCTLEHYKWYYLDDFCEISNEKQLKEFFGVSAEMCISGHEI